MNKDYELCIDLKLDKDESKKYLEDRLDCKVLTIEQANLPNEKSFNRYNAVIELSKPIHGNTNERKYFENKLEGSNIICYFHRTKNAS